MQYKCMNCEHDFFRVIKAGQEDRVICPKCRSKDLFEMPMTDEDRLAHAGRMPQYRDIADRESQV